MIHMPRAKSRAQRVLGIVFVLDLSTYDAALCVCAPVLVCVQWWPLCVSHSHPIPREGGSGAKVGDNSCMVSAWQRT